ncbi:MAG: alpha/beta hydrolase, partial [Candidatus Rokubacteria bacterium]|nr:alpha/beta hydrolase [Candidatus Rokubacteria bacterium]
RRPVDAWPLLPAIAAPTLLVRGEGSPIMTRDMAERMRAAIPRAFFVDIPGAFHHLTLDTPDTFVDVLAEFLAGVR